MVSFDARHVLRQAWDVAHAFSRVPVEEGLARAGRAFRSVPCVIVAARVVEVGTPKTMHQYVLIERLCLMVCRCLQYEYPREAEVRSRDRRHV